MKDIIFKGCGTAIATPFANDEIDYLEFKKLLKFQIKNKADSIIVCGTTGESATMTTKEKENLLNFRLKHVKEKFQLLQELVLIIQVRQLKCQKLQKV